MRVSYAVRRAMRARARRQRAGMFRLHAVVALWLWSRQHEVYIDLSASTVIGGIADFFASVVSFITGDIVTPIANAISWLAHQVEVWVGKLVASLWAAIGDISRLGTDLVDYVGGIFGQVVQWFSDVYGWVAQDVLDLLHDVSDVTGWLWSHITQAISDAFTAALSVGGDIWRWFYANVFDPLMTAFDTLRDTVENLPGWVLSIVQDVVNATIAGLFDAGSWVWSFLDNHFSDFINALLAPFTDLIQVVQGAFDFLTWVATHPFSWFTDQIDALWANGFDRLAELLASSFDQNADRLDGWLTAHVG